jgi:hypothetical protein
MNVARLRALLAGGEKSAPGALRGAPYEATEMNAAYLNLAIVSSIQIAVLIIVSIRRRYGWSLHEILTLMVASIPFGFAYDLLSGWYIGAFSYPDGTWSLGFLFANAVLSYGPAICTAYLVPIEAPASSLRTTVFLIFLVVSTGALASSVTLSGPLLLRIWLISVGLISLAEVGYAARNRGGVLSQLLKNRWRPFLILFIWSVLLGLVYEGANFLFPVWSWNLSPIPQPYSEVCILFGGYFVLFYTLNAVAVMVLGPNSSPAFDQFK